MLQIDDPRKELFFNFFRKYFQEGFKRTVSEEDIEPFWKKLSIIDLNSIQEVCRDLYRKHSNIPATPALIINSIEQKLPSDRNLSNFFSSNTCYIDKCMIESKSKLGVDNIGTDILVCENHEKEYWLAQQIVQYCDKVKELMEMRKNATESMKLFINHWEKFYGRNHVTAI